MIYVMMIKSPAECLPGSHRMVWKTIEVYLLCWPHNADILANVEVAQQAAGVYAVDWPHTPSGEPVLWASFTTDH